MFVLSIFFSFPSIPSSLCHKTKPSLSITQHLLSEQEDTQQILLVGLLMLQHHTELNSRVFVCVCACLCIYVACVHKLKRLPWHLNQEKLKTPKVIYDFFMHFELFKNRIAKPHIPTLPTTYQNQTSFVQWLLY